ncbi:MAG TPA: type I-U CRISPR-associated protein Csb2 [Burkholderiales bacterium]|nr:type I-U CRISPR-associated protein Csb2 [Burkholderiales bacterium]
MTEATVIEVELLSGRYHAHLWGEAQFGMAGPEWPPSPWRLLRALASSWFCAPPHPSSVEDRDRLLEALGRSGAPEIWLPRASFHELRYYQPIRLGASDRVLHHDHFAVPEGGRFWFRFKTVLQSDQQALLAGLLERLRYLGRSESRARLRVVNRDEPPAGVWSVGPRGLVQQSSPVTYRRVLCTTAEFRASDLWSGRGRDETTATGSPPHLVNALLGEKMPLPCGARWIEYAIPAAALIHEIRPRVSASPAAPDVNVAEIRFRLSRRIPIPLRYVVAVARAFRDAAVESHEERSGQISLLLSGREADGTMDRRHQHVYYMPRLRAGTVTMEKLVVRVPAGRLSRLELDALLGVGRIHAGGARYPITVVPEVVDSAAGPATAARRWRSATPFLPPLRHRRRRDMTRVDQQVAACIDRFYGFRPARVKRVAGPDGLSSVTALVGHEYVRGDPGLDDLRWKFSSRLGFWLELDFDEPVALWAPVGADAHFGAGQFVPVEP